MQNIHCIYENIQMAEKQMDQDLYFICHLREVVGLHAVCGGEYILTCIMMASVNH